MGVTHMEEKRTRMIPPRPNSSQDPMKEKMPPAVQSSLALGIVLLAPWYKDA